ncbi:hypothetical protein Pla110_23990 [Polystyrenella longa]|uniref:SHOCT domain-containing protein n=1 Tax=Polystyrenella longa TaxID=2528007 RepID=A0A518CN69_9PLAN|nr:hypothetical protein [Polystyrenella longa]QDU80667.1 hypothetical protein Pla110_23990 [Polystyrenella longa]
MLVKISALAIFAGVLCSVGCFGLTLGGTQGATNHTHTHNYSSPTLAQELTELKKIKDEGIIAEHEYALAQNKLINDYGSIATAARIAQGDLSNIEQVSHAQATDTSNLKRTLVAPHPLISVQENSSSTD